jgi:hypothetical protein
MKTQSKINNGTDILSAPLLNKIREKHSELYGRFYGNFFRSTMSFQNKIFLLENFLARGNITKLTRLISIFKEHYRVEDIPKRNKEWRCHYGI